MENVKKDKFDELGQKRTLWLEEGHEPKTMIENSLNSFSKYLKKGRLVLILDKIIDLVDEVKTFRFRSENKESFPTFKPGQYIAITIKIGGRYLTETYTLTSLPNEAIDGIYEITVFKNNNPVTKYLFESVKENDILVSSSPCGDFYYDRVRDSKNVIAITGFDEVLPIYAMAKSDTFEYHYNMTIFYYGESLKDLKLKNEFERLKEETSRIKVIYVLSKEEKNGYQKGYVSLNKIKPELEDDSCIFISCHESMLNYFDKELEELRLPLKYIHYYKWKNDVNIRPAQTFNLTIYINDEKFETKCYNNKTILQSILELGIYVPSKCQNGTCGLCQSELVFGKVKIINDERSISDKKYNFIHPCVTYPLSDIEIIIR